jgi:hypothetical protein
MANGILSLPSDYPFEGRIQWSSVVNKTANTSTVSYSVQIRRTDGAIKSTHWNGTIEAWNYNANYDGENPFFENHFVNRALRPDEQWTAIDSGTFSISHDDDGSSWVGFWVALDEQPSLLGASIHTEIDDDDYIMYLDTITRLATITSAPDITDATTSITIKYSNPMGNGASSLQVCIADETGNNILIPYRNVNKTGSSYTFNLSSTERQALVNNVKSGTTATIRYYIKLGADDGEHRRFLTKTFTLTTGMPTISATIADMNETTKALTGDYNTFIRYMSDAAVSINAVAKQGATIVRCDCECGPFSEHNTNGIFQVPRVETGVFVVKATDSRGNQVSQTIQKTMMLYEKVSCNLSVSMELDGSTGATAHLNIKGNYYDGRFGTTSAAQSNTITLMYCYGVVGGNWGTWQTITVPTSAISNNQYNISKEISGLNYQTNYKFQCYVADKLTTAFSEEIERKLQPVFDWSGTDFNFNVPVKFQSEYAMNDYIVEQGTEEMGTNGTWYWFKYKSGRAECYGLRNFGNMGVSTAHGALYRSAALTQQLPQDVFMSNSVPDYISINVVANGTGWICRDGGGSSPAYYTTGSFYVVSPTSGNQSAVWLGFHVMGRWK